MRIVSILALLSMLTGCGFLTTSTEDMEAMQNAAKNMRKNTLDGKLAKIRHKQKVEVEEAIHRGKMKSVNNAELGKSYIEGVGEKPEDTETNSGDSKKNLTEDESPDRGNVAPTVIKETKTIFEARPCSKQGLGTVYPNANQSFRNFITVANATCGPGTLDLDNLKKWNRHITNPSLIYQETPVCMPWRVIRECINAYPDPTKKNW